MVNALIAVVLIVAIAVIVTGIGLAISRSGQPKDARRREVKAARAAENRAKVALHDVRQLLAERDLATLDIVGAEMRRAALSIIADYEAKELRKKEEG